MAVPFGRPERLLASEGDKVNTAQLESPFFLSEADALALIDANMDDIKSKIDASSGQNSNESVANATNGPGTGANPCNDNTDYGLGVSSCNCCQCA